MNIDDLTIRGLSLTRPWPYAFVLPPNPRGVAPKRVENRSKRPPRGHVGHWLALHAAQSWDEGDREFIATTTGLYVPSKSESPHGQIFAVCKLMSSVESAERLLPDQRAWFFGPHGWVIDYFVELKTPVECKGALGLWGFDSRPGAWKQLRESFEEAAGA